MSERGSFVTEYFYCNKCFKIVKKAFLNNIEECDQVLNFPIIAGKASGLYPHEEVHSIMYILDSIKSKVCHSITVAVITDSGKVAKVKIEPTIVEEKEIEKGNMQ